MTIKKESSSVSRWKRFSRIKIVGIFLLLISSIMFGAYIPLSIEGDI